jgi:hypothetical protein
MEGQRPGQELVDIAVVQTFMDEPYGDTVSIAGRSHPRRRTRRSADETYRRFGKGDRTTSKAVVTSRRS